ncbi:Pfs domain protein [Talaromyces pinophilus]|uniref:Pfs domain protein n=1 Tax=Talaromyces pinophilus TaxID=128442 RepID=A0A478EAA0_TALPI|nr:Pfs domain protein [Talaromyces pinophilus]
MTEIQLSHADYTVGWICALSVEMAAASVMLDETHSNLPVHASDHNAYTLGRIGNHNIAIASLPSGVAGTTSAAVVASQLTSSFPSIRFLLMVGIGGGVPDPDDKDIRLGDVVVSQPGGTSGGVVQFDFGKAQDGTFQRTGMLNKPSEQLLRAVAKVQSDYILGRGKVFDYISKLKNFSDFVYPGEAKDLLFQPDYHHTAPASTCKRCDRSRLVVRLSRSSTVPKVHYGLIASSNQVIRDGEKRDRLAEDLDIICFETEAAGLMDNFPCLVIRGISDYADSHKNDQWHAYAAATAAAFSKELLHAVPSIQGYQERYRQQDRGGQYYPGNYYITGSGPVFLGNVSAGRDINNR